MTFVFALLALSTLAMFGPFAIIGYGWMLFASAVSAGKYLDAIGAEVNWPAVSNWIGVFLAVVGLAALIPVLGVTILGSAAMFAAIAGVISAIYSVIQ